MIESSVKNSSDASTLMMEDDALTHPQKKLFPTAGITKQQVAEYYETIADFIMPHIKDRPLMLERYPEGVDKKGFFQKDFDQNSPDFVQTVMLDNLSQPGETQYMMCQNTRSLEYLVNLDCITPHTWLSRADKPDMPDKMVIDLDPADVTYYEEVVKAAFILKGHLEEANMCPHVMTTGSRGLHIVCPLRRNRSFERVRNYLREMTERAAEQHPHLLTTEMRKDKRGERIYLDIARNAYGQTAVVPYALRPMAHAPVATPLRWKELENEAVHPQKFNIKNILARVAEQGDVWDNFYRHKRKLMR
jgi:bifunctional non-homologous end joining protein LigD